MPDARSRHCDAARGRREPRPGHVDEHRAAPPGHPRTCVMAYFNNEIIEMVCAPEPVTGAVSRYQHMAIVAPARRVLAPGVLRPDPARRECGRRPRAAV